MFHKIQNGDKFKLLPNITTDNKISWIKEIDCIFIDDKIIYDLESKWIEKLKPIIYKEKYDRTSTIFNKVNYSKRYYINFLNKQGGISTFNSGKGLYKIITENSDKLTNIRSNWHLNISMEIRNTYPVYDKTNVVESNWNCPISDINDQNEWIQFIKTNSPNLDNYFKERDIIFYRDDISKIFGKDLISEIISNKRSDKLNELGI